ncbi:50S ribosomal protein L17 [Cephaloticoccus capnophilus]|uniref:Large ribosomal subunit protein bL17 n=1 Tax=Cephaloticoccus capnophilus TaxID=1548208 RepID=A0A139SJQ3_9BACT|nr:50S ribosomal protein L17 [Cephaloticoccus capnophilus]
MRHKKHRATLGVTREHREAMLSNMTASLITHGRIKTTLTKAKALRPFAEKLITKAKRAAAKTDPKDALHLRRLAHRDLRDENALTLLFNDKVNEFKDRNGGYTRIYKLGPRLGDAAEMALIELVKADDPGYKKRGSRGKAAASKAKKTAKPAAAAAEVKDAEPAVEAPAAAETPAPEAAVEAPAASEAETK